MNHNYPGFQSALQPTAAPFSMCGSVRLDGTPLLQPQFFGQPPPSFPVQYAFYPGSSFLSQVPGVSWTANPGLIQPRAVIGQHALLTEFGPSLPASVNYPVADPSLITFAERAKKCGITIEPINHSTVSQPSSTSGNSHYVQLSSKSCLPNEMSSSNTSCVPQHYVQFSSQSCLPSESTEMSSFSTSLGRCVPQNYVQLSYQSCLPSKPNEMLSSSTSLSSSVQSFQSAVGTTQKNVLPCDTDSHDYSENIDYQDSNSILSGAVSKCPKSMHVKSRGSCKEASLGRRSWPNVDGNEDTGSVLSFDSPLPSFKHRSDDSVLSYHSPSHSSDTFTLAAESWHSSDRSKDASSQTPVVMTISACVGTTHKRFVDASTNTNSSTSQKYAYCDVATSTEKQNVILAEDIGDLALGEMTKEKAHADSRCKLPAEESSSTVYAASDYYKGSDSPENHGGLTTSGGLRTSSANKYHCGAEVEVPDDIPLGSSGHIRPRASLFQLGRLSQSCFLDEDEPSEGSVCSLEHTTHSPYPESYKPSPPGLEHLGVCVQSNTKELIHCEDESGNGMMSHVTNYQSISNQRTDGPGSAVEPSKINDDVYYSDDDDDETDESAALRLDHQSTATKNSFCIDGTIKPQGANNPCINPSMKQRELINQMMTQMVIVNPSLAGCNPVLLRGLVLRFLASESQATPAILQAEQPVQHSVRQLHPPVATNVASCVGKPLSVKDSKSCTVGIDSSGARSRSMREESLVVRPLFIAVQDEPPRRYRSDSSELRFADQDNLHSPSFVSHVNDLSEDQLPTHNSIMTRGRGRSLSPDCKSADVRKIKPRGRGRGKLLDVQDVDLRCFSLSDGTRPGNTNRLPARSAPLHPPAAAINKPTVEVNKQPLSRCSDSQDAEDWDEE